MAKARKHVDSGYMKEPLEGAPNTTISIGGGAINTTASVEPTKDEHSEEVIDEDLVEEELPDGTAVVGGGEDLTQFED